MESKNKTILVVDDDDDLQILLSKILKGSGFSTISANSVETGLEALKSHVPHLVLVDLNLGEHNGYQFLQAKKELSGFEDVPVVLLTAHTNKKAISHGLALGALDFIAKPISSLVLLQKIKKHLKSHQFPTIHFPKPEMISITTDASLSHICEVGCLIKSPIKFANDTNIDIQSSYLKELKIENIKYHTVGDSRYSSTGTYQTETAFLGISEKNAKQIRTLKTYARKN